MRIDRLHIEGFGHFRNHPLELSPGLNLLHGANEAGKSTLLGFVRAMLFGFEKRSSTSRYEPEEGPFGGELHLSAHFGALRVKRRGGKRTEGELTVVGPQGEQLPDSRLIDALAGISKELFYEVFAFGLHELSSFERLASQGSVSEALFAAGMQGAQRLPAALEALRRSAEATFTPRGSKPALNAVLDELMATREKIKAAGDRPRLYFEAASRLGVLEKELAATEHSLARATGQRDVLGRLCSVLPDLQALAAAQEELDGLPELSQFPEGGLIRLDELERNLANVRAERDEAMAKGTALDEQLAFLAEGPRPRAFEQAMRASLEAFAARQALRQGLGARRAAFEEKRRQLERSAGALGLKLDAKALVGLELGAASRGALVVLRDRCGESERLLAIREEAWKTARGERERAEAEVRRITAELAKLPATAAVQVRRRAAALARLRPALDELQRLQERRAELSAAAEGQRGLLEPSPREGFPVWALWLSLAVLAGGALGVLLAAPPGAAAAAVAGAVALAVLLWRVQRRAASSLAEQRAAAKARTEARERELARLRSELGALDGREASAKQAIEDCCTQAQVEPAAGAARLEALAMELAEELDQIELRGRLAQDLESLTARLAAAAHAEREAKADRDLAEAGISKLLREVDALGQLRGFPRGLSANAALDLWAEAAALKARLLDLLTEEQAFRADKESCEAAAQAVLESAGQAGLQEACGGGPEAAAQALSVLLGKDQQAQAERQHLLEKKESVSAALARASAGCAQTEASLSALLRQGGAEDPEAFRARAGQAARWQAATRVRREHASRVEAGTAMSAEAARDLVREAGGAEGLAQQRARASEQVSELTGAAKQLADERGAIRERVQGFERDTEVAGLRVAEEALAAEAGELAARYAVDRLALSLLSGARRRFEEEQQPRVVKLASGIFCELTGGRYTKVFATAGAGRDLSIRDLTGRDWSAEKLSRGTRELLYFAFRLAVIEDFGETKVALPVIVDDILVNLDPERTRAAIAVLSRLAQKHQVIAFTCHPDLIPLFEARGAKLVAVAAVGG